MGLRDASASKKESVEVADGGCGLERGRGGGGTLKTHTAPIHGATQHKEQSPDESDEAVKGNN